MYIATRFASHGVGSSQEWSEGGWEDGGRELKTFTALLEAIGEGFYVSERIIEAAASKPKNGVQILER